MAVATIGAFAMVLFPDTDPHMAEGAAVMLFYQSASCSSIRRGQEPQVDQCHDGHRARLR